VQCYLRHSESAVRGCEECQGLELYRRMSVGEAGGECALVSRREVLILRNGFFMHMGVKDGDTGTEDVGVWHESRSSYLWSLGCGFNGRQDGLLFLAVRKGGL